MNKKLKKLALKGICSGLLVSAPGLMASQGSDAMNSFTANSSGQAHSNYLAGGCGGGCGGAGSTKGNNLTAYEHQPQQSYNHGCGAHSCGNKGSHQQGYNSGSYNSHNQNQYQQGGYNSGSCNSQNQNQYQKQSGCNSGSWNGYNQHSTNSNNHSNTPNQGTYANEDGVQIEYDNGGNPAHGQQGHQNVIPKGQGHTALNDAVPRSTDSLYNQQNNSDLNKTNSGIQPGKGQQTLPQNQAGQPGQRAMNPKTTGQLADGTTPQNQKPSENDLKAKRNNAAYPNNAANPK